MIRMYGCKLKYEMSAFALLASELVKEFKNSGELGRYFYTEYCDIFEGCDDGVYINDFGERHINIYFPFHYALGKTWSNGFRGGILVGIADTDEFNEEIVEKLRGVDYKYFVTPSKYVGEVFGLDRTEVIPHFLLDGVDKVAKQKRKQNTVPTFYINASHTWQRRGLDLSFRSLKALAEKGKKFKAVIRVWDANDIQVNEDWCEVVSGYLPYEKHLKLLHNSDYFLHPVRGGAFEMSILEALALGVTPIITDAPPFNEVPLRREDYVGIPVEKKDYVWRNQWHTGKMWMPELSDVEKVVASVLEGEPLKIDTGKYFEYYNKTRVAKMFLDLIHK
jgi:glycosyltransferase involved in cell wall biosynthesis